MKIPAAKAGGGGIFCLRVVGVDWRPVAGPPRRTPRLGLGVGWDLRWVARGIGDTQGQDGRAVNALPYAERLRRGRKAAPQCGAEKRAGLKARPYNGDDGGNDYGWAERRAGLPLRLGGLADRKGLPLRRLGRVRAATPTAGAGGW